MPRRRPRAAAAALLRRPAQLPPLVLRLREARAVALPPMREVPAVARELKPRQPHRRPPPLPMRTC